MNTPKKRELDNGEIRALAVEAGLDPSRLRFLDGAVGPFIDGADASSDEAQLVVEGYLIADYESLTDVQLRKATETADGLYIAESSKIIARALEAGHSPRSFLMTREWFTRLVDVLAGEWASDAPVLIGSVDRVEEVTGFHVHRGPMAAVARPPLVPVLDVIDQARRVVVVEDIVDHTNVGAIFRSAAGLGFDAVLLSPESADPLYRRSIRVSMGTVFHVPWARFTEWPTGLRNLREAGFTVAALALTEESVSLREFAADAPDRVALVMGTEGDGLKRSTIAEADTTVRIPMMHGVDSLNVAAATAVACFALQPTIQ